MSGFIAFVVIYGVIKTRGTKDVDSLSVAVDNAQTLYMSQDNLFILGSEYISEYEIEQQVTRELLQDKLTTGDKDIISLIEQTDNRILSQSEKEQNGGV